MADNSSLEWLEEESEYTQALVGTLFTWFMTALGAGMIFILPLKSKNTKTLLDCSLGFAAGVMLAASYWSLLAPALEKAEPSYGVHRYAPVAFGFLLGAAFVAYAGSMSFIENAVQKHTKSFELENNISMEKSDSIEAQALNEKSKKELENKQNSFRRMIALVIAITVHNIPEGLAVGVGFGGADFAQARNLAIGIGIQNFPEGLAVSLPLAASGETLGKSFFWGQLSGLVEPIFGMLGVFTVSISSVLLPYALGFAAGAMIYVVMDDIVPDACSRDNASLAAKFSMIGFVVMMTLDVALG
jgi:zinc transporter 11